MSITTGQTAIMTRIATMETDANIVWPDGPGAGLPRYVMQAAGGAQRTATLAGQTDADPEVVVRVETLAGTYATANTTLVAALVARFRPGDRFGGVTILDAPSVRPPLPVIEGVYSVPVVIRGRFYF